MARGAPSGASEAVVTFHRLHYGKLGEGEERRIPASEGYAVTRRSAGLDRAWDPHLSPLRLTGLRRFEPDAIDIGARSAGCLVARAVGDSMIFMRARFRPEDGERGSGRLHQQAAILVGSFESFRGHPAGCLSIAAHDLRALPDLASEGAAVRLNEAPLRWRVSRPDPEGVRRILERAPWAFPMLETLLDGADNCADACRDFGARDFPDEGAFLAAVGFVLELLPSAYPRWRDVSVVSGLANPLPGLCLRYVPSLGRAQAA
ncbi:hypothetical protein OGR47_03180 [Methylocystis sp. MJC1]|jgi:hypothetical protein|uniref:hypothetical protein n=1 Tax=Methylocystis sp. MJC1 TaxID=2654282 RepID=UPI0013ED61BD|nr:hypothetical protein [Methylocystis sp. MJC1]KAF2991062.1 hypothetical protein MJC1_01794 [Methylocystis sp. MJC1]MBU6526017.1 hypothetical protein [Methylocystis sp. MJC1]UZX12484.1 hypothetical protein OGR47_03180 [Methylocystis sp. MJC1]